MIEAKNSGANVAVFIVHEFISKFVDNKNVEANNRDFENFARTLTRRPNIRLHLNKLVEINDIPGGEFVPGARKLLIGKIQTKLI